MTDRSEVNSMCEGYGTKGNCDICPANCSKQPANEKSRIKMFELITMPIPEFLADGWIEYLDECSDRITEKTFGSFILKIKLRLAGYQIGKDGTVYPF